MKIFNIEEKNNEKKRVCYIQVKDLKYLKDEGIHVNAQDNLDGYLYVFNKKTLKSFVKLDNQDEVNEIHDKDKCIIDLGEILNDGKMDLYPHLHKLEKEEKILNKMRSDFLGQFHGVYLGHLMENPEYVKIVELESILCNKLDDLIDIRDFIRGYNEINLPQEPYSYGLLTRLNDIAVYRGINPNEYIILSKKGDTISDDIINEVKENRFDDELKSSILPEFAINTIHNDVKLQRHRRGYKDDYITYEYKVSSNKKYLIVRTNYDYFKEKKMNGKTKK